MQKELIAYGVGRPKIVRLTGFLIPGKPNDLTPEQRRLRKEYIAKLVLDVLMSGCEIAQAYDDQKMFVDSYAMYQCIANVVDQYFAKYVEVFKFDTDVVGRYRSHKRDIAHVYLIKNMSACEELLAMNEMERDQLLYG